MYLHIDHKYLWFDTTVFESKTNVAISASCDYNESKIWLGDFMDECKQKRTVLLNKFTKSQPLMNALGNEMRQRILYVLIAHASQGGLRVKEIEEATAISKAAVSHHLHVLLETKIVARRKEGTKNYYYINANSSSLRTLADLFRDSIDLLAYCNLRKDE